MREFKSLLLIEDSELVTRSLERLFRTAPFQVTSVNTCGAALGLSRRFDVGVLDIDLPDGNGINLAEILLSRGIVAKVIFFSGSSDSEVSRRALVHGPLIRKSAGAPALLQALFASDAPLNGRIAIESPQGRVEAR